MELEKFDDCIDYLKKEKRQIHVLMGNGFSMAYDSTIFSYKALHQYIEELDHELLSKLFTAIKTMNFELIMNQLDEMKKIAVAFEAEDDFVDKLDLAKEELKKGLIDAVKELHPEHVYKIPELKSEACAEFFRMFLDNKGNLFTTNYDILMYWILMKSHISNACDGFGRDVEYSDYEFGEPDVSELLWARNKDKQNVHYLHGALPIFDTGVEILKEEYDSENFLLEKIKNRMSNNSYPIFVTAGNGQDKLEHIRHNQYLSYCYDKLSNIEGTLITYGFSFGEFDDHIIDAINLAAKKGVRTGSKLFSIYIGVYSDQDVKHINSIKKKFKCKVHIFDARTAKVWG